MPISYYEKQLKEAIMNNLLAQEGPHLKELLNNLILENEKDINTIKNAYLIVKIELVG